VNKTSGSYRVFSSEEKAVFTLEVLKVTGRHLRSRAQPESRGYPRQAKNLVSL
jgi:hypothetical protein